jgi:hypothetical protein
MASRPHSQVDDRRSFSVPPSLISASRGDQGAQEHWPVEIYYPHTFDPLLEGLDLAVFFMAKNLYAFCLKLARPVAADLLGRMEARLRIIAVGPQKITGALVRCVELILG